MTAAAREAAPIATARLDLTPCGPGDLMDIVALHQEARVTRWLIDAAPDTPFKAGQYLHWAQGLHRRGYGPWTARRRGDGRFLGLFTLTPFPEDDDTVLELGGRLAPSAWTGGFAHEAGAALIAHAFGPLARRELASAYHPDNRAVPPLLARLGFRDPRPAQVFGRDALVMRQSVVDWQARKLAPGELPAPSGDRV